MKSKEQGVHNFTEALAGALEDDMITGRSAVLMGASAQAAGRGHDNERQMVGAIKSNDVLKTELLPEKA
eukprot:3033287-Pleurochrysis_carterae.AAC.5